MRIRRSHSIVLALAVGLAARAHSPPPTVIRIDDLSPEAFQRAGTGCANAYGPRSSLGRPTADTESAN